MIRTVLANPGGTSSISGQGSKIPHTMWWGQKKKKKTKDVC